MPHYKKTPSSWIQNHGCRGRRDSNLPVHLFSSYMTIYQIVRYLYVRIDVWEKFTKHTKTAPAAVRRREHGLGCYLQGQGGEQGEVRPAISTLKGRPHLDLGRLRLTTWSKSDFSIAETTWRTLFSMYLLAFV